MFPSLAPVVTKSPPAIRLPYARWVALALVLLLEMIAFTVRFDGQDLVGRGGSWGLAASVYATLGRPAIVVAIVASWLGAKTIHQKLRDSAESARDHSPHFALAIHFALYAAMFCLTEWAIRGQTGDAARSDFILALTLACGLSSLLALGAAMIPWWLWGGLLRAAWMPALLAVGTGGLAFVASRSTASLWESFHSSTFRAASAILGLWFSEPICDSANLILGARNFSVEISPQCSGYEGIGLIWAFLTVYLVFFRRDLRFPAAFLLFPLGTGIIWVANILRIVALIAIGANGHPDVAIGGFHSQSGWIAFNAVGLGLVLATRRSSFFRRLEVSPDTGETINPAPPLLLPLLALVATQMVGAAVSAGGFDYAYPARVVAVAAVLWVLRRRYAAIEWSWSWSAISIGVALFLLWMALEPAANRTPEANVMPAALKAMPPFAAAAWVLFRVLGSVITVPIAEELAFRGFLTRWLISRDIDNVPPGQFAWPSFLISSALFGALHGRWLAGFAAGLAYALALYRRGKLGDAIVAHAVTNGMIAIAVLASGYWSLWN